MIEAFPLYWPTAYKRTKSRRWSRFKVTMDKAQRFLRDELLRMGATGLIISTNIPVRKDGMLYTDWMSKKIDDPGVAIYFKYKGKDVSMCCDQYEKIWENIYALGKGIEALRGMERWGVSDFLDRAFTGFTALPPPQAKKEWWSVMGYSQKPSIALCWAGVEAQYKSLAKQLHPDMPAGSTVAFQELQSAFMEAKKYFGN